MNGESVSGIPYYIHTSGSFPGRVSGSKCRGPSDLAMFFRPPIVRYNWMGSKNKVVIKPRPHWICCWLYSSFSRSRSRPIT